MERCQRAYVNWVCVLVLTAIVVIWYQEHDQNETEQDEPEEIWEGSTSILLDETTPPTASLDDMFKEKLDEIRNLKEKCDSLAKQVGKEMILEIK